MMKKFRIDERESMKSLIYLTDTLLVMTLYLY